MPIIVLLLILHLAGMTALQDRSATINGWVCQIDRRVSYLEQTQPKYVWGGSAGPLGGDCSGQTYWAFRGLPVKRETALGMWLGRGGWGTDNTQDKALMLKSVFPDLIFFQNARPADHVGIVREVSEGKLIFAESPNKRSHYRRTELTRPNYYGKHWFGSKRIPFAAWVP
jgi:hypothetical protein